MTPMARLLQSPRKRGKYAVKKRKPDGSGVVQQVNWSRVRGDSKVVPKCFDAMPKQRVFEPTRNALRAPVLSGPELRGSGLIVPSDQDLDSRAHAIQAAVDRLDKHFTGRNRVHNKHHNNYKRNGVTLNERHELLEVHESRRGPSECHAEICLDGSRGGDVHHDNQPQREREYSHSHGPAKHQGDEQSKQEHSRYGIVRKGIRPDERETVRHVVECSADQKSSKHARKHRAKVMVGYERAYEKQN